MKEEEIRSAIHGMTQETLADAFALLLSEEKVPNKGSAQINKPNVSNFAEAILYLKKEYGFTELDLFTTEADLVYVQAGDRRVLLTDSINGSGKSISQYKKNENTETEHFSEKKDSGRFSHLEL
jgi:hypothetical protein